MNAQEIFDTVAAHLIKQGRPSKVRKDYTDMCLYRGPRGTSCAVGCLMTEDEYDPEMEHNSVTHLDEFEKGRAFLKRMGEENKGLLRDLQEVHDYQMINDRGRFYLRDLKADLRRVAHNHELKVNF